MFPAASSMLVRKFLELEEDPWASLIKIYPESSYSLSPLSNHSMVHTPPSSNCSLDLGKPPDWTPVSTLSHIVFSQQRDDFKRDSVTLLLEFFPAISHSQHRSQLSLQGPPKISMIRPVVSPLSHLLLQIYRFSQWTHTQVYFMAFALVLPSAWNTLLSFLPALIFFTSNCGTFNLWRIVSRYVSKTWKQKGVAGWGCHVRNI